jgi:hypothetical protein
MRPVASTNSMNSLVFNYFPCIVKNLGMLLVNNGIVRVEQKCKKTAWIKSEF